MMKRKCIIIGIIIAGICIISFCMLTRPNVLGNMKHSYSEQTTATSDISFLGEVGDRIKFSFRSNVENGDLDIILYDSKGNQVYELDRATALETFFNLSNSDTYTLAAECSRFIGQFEISVYKAN